MIIFVFFGILVVSMATAAILKKITLKGKLHMTYDIPTSLNNVIVLLKFNRSGRKL
jgi:hypothetical protein